MLGVKAVGGLGVVLGALLGANDGKVESVDFPGLVYTCAFVSCALVGVLIAQVTIWTWVMCMHTLCYHMLCYDNALAKHGVLCLPMR